MPLQNRVDPRGTIFRSTARGTMMGNRGPAIHNEHREIVRPFNGRRWITCVLEFKGRRRTVMSPGRYTELFFLDEAVAFAAGHRPCAECRRARFNEFRRAWMASIAPERAGKSPAPEIDAELHRARIDRWGGKVTYEAPFGVAAGWRFRGNRRRLLPGLGGGPAALVAGRVSDPFGPACGPAGEGSDAETHS